MAYSVEYIPPKCEKCIKNATQRVFLRHGEFHGFYCTKHGNEAVEWLNKEAHDRFMSAMRGEIPS